MRERARMDEPLDRLHERNDRADEDRQDDTEAGEPFAALAAEEERQPERNSGERVAEVMDQVGEQRDAERARVDERLRKRRDREDREAPRDGAEPGVRAQNRPIDQPM